MLLLQDAVQKYGFRGDEAAATKQATIANFESDLLAMIRARANHPSIVQWQIFNENDCNIAFDTPPHRVIDVVALARAADWQGRLFDMSSGGPENIMQMVGQRVGVSDVMDEHMYARATAWAHRAPHGRARPWPLLPASLS